MLAQLMQHLDVPSKEIAETFAFFDLVRPYLLARDKSTPPRRIVDVGGGQGLAALCWLCLSDVSEATIVDQYMPRSHVKAVRALRGEIRFNTPDYFVGKLTEFEPPGDERLAFVGIHCCGGLSDELIDVAIHHAAPFAVMTCCHPFRDPLLAQAEPWLAAGADQSHLMDVLRLDRARQRGYTVELATIDATITPKNRILMGKPRAPSTKKRPTRGPARATLAWEDLKAHRGRKHHINTILKAAGLGPLASYDEQQHPAHIDVQIALKDGGQALLRIAPRHAKRFDAVDAFEREAATRPPDDVLAVDGRGKLIRNVYMLMRA